MNPGALLYFREAGWVRLVEEERQERGRPLPVWEVSDNNTNKEEAN